jgi:GDP-mannose 6-dehydrogenase
MTSASLLQPRRIAVFGLGYVGTVTAACLAREGHTVVGVDIDPNKVAAIRSGTSPIVEPGLEELITAGRASGRLQATTRTEVGLEACDVAMVCVGTPSLWNGGVDLRHLEAVCDQIGSSLRSRLRPLTIVFRSTVPPGTVEGHLVPRLEAASGCDEGTTFSVAMCPEFLRESTAIADFYDPPFTVCGANDGSVADEVEGVFSFIDRPFRAVELATAEAVKYACNAFHASKVAFANEIGRVTASCGVDGRQVMDLVCSDDRLNIAPTYLRPGFAFGGSCLPKDLRALLHLARTTGDDLPMLAGVLASNDVHIASAVRGVLATGAQTVALLGLSFKPDTDDLRESPSVELAERLLGKGLDVRIYDQNVRLERVTGTNEAFARARLPHLARVLTDDAASALDGADCAIVCTPEAAVIEGIRSRPPRWILDLCGSLPHDVEDLPGYWGAAWPGRAAVIDLRDGPAFLAPSGLPRTLVG